MLVNGVLLLYHHGLARNASTVMEHVEAFSRHSQFKVWSVNTGLGFPEALDRLSFEGIVLHYSLFGPKYEMNQRFLDWLERNESYKIAFFQDEHRFCQRRFGFLNHFKVNCVFTLVEPAFYRETYEKYTKVSKIVYTLPGYVSDDLIRIAEHMTVPDEMRKTDVGYRGRKLEYYMGKGSQEKYEIAVDFLKLSASLGLKLDIEAEEEKRIYGEDWYEFIANCRAVLGVEAGVSVFDVKDVVYRKYREFLASKPKLPFNEISKQLLEEWEGRIPYRTISPRHFEAAALRVCQILFEGKYSGIMKPMVHYIPLKKDFSNFGEVIRMFRDNSLRQKLADDAYRDLIASGKYSYGKFVRGIFDEMLLQSGLQPEITLEEAKRVTDLLMRGAKRRRFYAMARSKLYRSFPGRREVITLLKPAVSIYRNLRPVSEWHLPVR